MTGRLPLTVIGGYLGAGKTTLINRMLAEPHGQRLMVMVNDFGAVNIDASLIARQTDDVLALTNGCVCCTMGADLYMAIGDVLDRAERPDHLVIEASGIADPRAIANTAIAEPDLRYAGIITLVDALNILRLLDDPLVSPQVCQQIAVADLVLLTKSTEDDPGIGQRMKAAGLPQPRILPADAVSVLALDVDQLPDQGRQTGHVSFTSWQHRSTVSLDIDAIEAALGQRPAGLYRLKGFLRGKSGGSELHVVGGHVELRPIPQPEETVLVGLGPSDILQPGEVESWWQLILRQALSSG